MNSKLYVPELANDSPLAWDLETVPNPEMVKHLPEPKPRGNLKDPEKIAADIAEKHQKQIGGMALNGNTALIVAAGFSARMKGGELWSEVLIYDERTGEKDFLCALWDVLSAAKRYITFNGVEFDVPVLLRRSLVREVLPPVTISTRKYDIPPAGNHYDLRLLLSHFGAMSTGGLDMMCEVVLGEGKYADDGASGRSDEIGELWAAGEFDKIRARARRDAELTYRLWERAKGIYFPGSRR